MKSLFCNYLNIVDSQASPLLTWNAKNSIDGGGNKGWVFVNTVAVDGGWGIDKRKRKYKEKEDREELNANIKASFALVMEEGTEEEKEIIAPFVKKAEKIDYAAVQRAIAENELVARQIQAMIAEYQRQMDEQDIEALLLAVI